MSVPICLRAANRVGREADGFCSALWAARSVFSGGMGVAAACLVVAFCFIRFIGRQSV